MKKNTSLLAVLSFLILGSSMLAACTTGGSTGANTSASAEEAATHFMDTLVASGFDAAEMYVAPSQREDAFFLANWKNMTMKVTSYSNVVVDEPAYGTTTVEFDLEGAMDDGTSMSAPSYVDTAEIDGVWWVVSSSYQPE